MFGIGGINYLDVIALTVDYRTSRANADQVFLKVEHRAHWPLTQQEPIRI